MKLTEDIKKYIDQSVLCWIATVDDENVPSVSPKEIFKAYEDKIIIANIASPQTVTNIIYNENVCISFIDILVQKGYQLKGKAKIIRKVDVVYSTYEKELLELIEGDYPFETITEIEIDNAKQILSPSYILYPDTTESQQIENARKTYKL